MTTIISIALILYGFYKICVYLDMKNKENNKPKADNPITKEESNWFVLWCLNETRLKHDPSNEMLQKNRRVLEAIKPEVFAKVN